MQYHACNIHLIGYFQYLQNYGIKTEIIETRETQID